MRNALAIRSLALATILLTAFAFRGMACYAQADNQPSSGQDASLRKFLQQYVHDDAMGRETMYSSAFVDLQDDGNQEAIVYLLGNEWCGSGGCTTLILAPQGPSFRIVTRITIAQLPMRALTTKSQGWHDLGVWVAGGGIRGYEAGLPFDGRTYPRNPSVAPARHLAEKVPGKVLISEDTTRKPLF